MAFARKLRGMVGPALAALLFALAPAAAETRRPGAGSAAEPCELIGTVPEPESEAVAVAVLRRLVRLRCHDEALAYADAVVPTLPWADGLRALGVAAELPVGERRLERGRLALAETILGRLGAPPADDDVPRRAAVSTEALLTVVCLQADPLPPATLAGLPRRFVAAQRPDGPLAAELLAMRRVYLRWRYRIDCAAELAEALSVLEDFSDL